MRRPLRKPHGLALEDVQNYSGAPDYIIDLIDSNYVALNTSDGTIYKNTDYATTLQTTIDACPGCLLSPATTHNGAWIHNKFGHAYVSKQISIEKCIRLTGNMKGWGTTLELADNVDDIMFLINDTDTFHTYISDLNFCGNSANNNMGGEALINSKGHIYMVDCYISDAESKGLEITDSNNVLDRITIYQCKGSGLKLGTVTDTKIVNSCFWGNSDFGVLTSMDHGFMIACRIYLNGLDGIYMSGSQHTTISNCNVRLNDECGIYCDEIDFCSINNNLLADNSQKTDNTYSAVQLLDSTYNVINGNVVYGTGAEEDHKYCFEESGGNCAFNQFCCNQAIGAETGAYSIEADSGSSINGHGTESAAAETPQLAWPIGTIVDFTDSGDGSGDGIYIKDAAGNWDQLA